MARKKAAPTTNTPVDFKAQANKILDDSKNKFDAVVVIGVVNNKENIDVNTNVPQYAWLHHVLQKTVFELLLHEKEEMIKKNVAVSQEG